LAKNLYFNIQNFWQGGEKMKKKLHIPLRSLRKNNKISVEEMSAELSVTKQAISRWEIGKSYPEIHFLPQIANMFGVSIDFLLSYKPDEVEITAEEEENFKQKYFWKPTINFILEKVLRYKPPVKPLKVLEIGSEDGYMSIALARNGYIVTALEKDLLKIEKCRNLSKITKSKVNFIQQNILEFEFEEEFDIIFSNKNSAVPRTNREKIFEKIKSATKIDGVNIFKVMSEKNPQKIQFSSEETLWQSGEIFSYYNEWQFEEMKEEKIGEEYSNLVIARRLV